jgi:hypothetical protein
MKRALHVRKTPRDILSLVSVLPHESMVRTIDRLARQKLAGPDAALYKEEKVGS